MLDQYSNDALRRVDRVQRALAHALVHEAGTVAVEQKYSEGDKDFRAQLTAVKAANVDAVFVPGYYTEAALICKQARDLGIALPIFGGGNSIANSCR